MLSAVTRVRQGVLTSLPDAGAGLMIASPVRAAVRISCDNKRFDTARLCTTWRTTPTD